MLAMFCFCTFKLSNYSFLQTAKNAYGGWLPRPTILVLLPECPCIWIWSAGHHLYMGMWMFTGHHIVHQMQGEAKSEI